MATEKHVKIGEFGGVGVNAGDINQLPKTLQNIEIWSSIVEEGSDFVVINGIRFKYTDYDGNQHTIPSAETCWGTGKGNYHTASIDSDNGEYVIQIDGSFREDNDKKISITSLKFTTNKKTHHGPYGDPKNGTAFTVPLNNSGVYAFFGSYGTCLNSLGFYAHQPDADSKKP